jgi:small conductance mechanosensitive channel
MENFENSIERWFDQVIEKVPSIFMGFLIIVVGIYFICLTNKIVQRRFEKRNVDPSIRTFVSSLLRFVLYILLILTAANTMGIQTTSFIAALSAFGLAVGMALQGSLSNFAGGILILLFRPFEVGDYISSANGSGGTVERIDLLYTTLIDDEGLRVFSPNGTLANSVIKNYTKISSRRIYFSFLISYDSNIKEARKIILDVCQADNRILSKPAATVYVGDLNDNGVSLTVLAWTKKEDFGVVKNEIAEKIQTLIDGRNIVFPQTSIKILPNEEQA